MKIIIMDLDMPFMYGKEAAKKIRNHEKQMKSRPVPIFMISGNCTDSEIGEPLNPNGGLFDGFL